MALEFFVTGRGLSMVLLGTQNLYWDFSICLALKDCLRKYLKVRNFNMQLSVQQAFNGGILQEIDQISGSNDGAKTRAPTFNSQSTSMVRDSTVPR